MSSFLNKLLKYQQINNIKGRCMTHALLYYDYLDINGIPCKPVAGVLTYFNEERNENVVVCHCWCDVSGVAVDPSYEYSSVPYEKKYYSSIKEFFDSHRKVAIDKKFIVNKISWFDTQLRKAMKNTKMTPEYYKETGNAIKNI